MSAESLVFVIVKMSAVLLAWVSAYLVHSTILLAVAWLVTRMRSNTPATRELIWKTAVIAGLVTATLQSLPIRGEPGNRVDVSGVFSRAIWRDPGEARRISLNDGRTVEIFDSRLTAPSERIRLLPVAAISIWALYALLILARVGMATKRARAALGPRTEVREGDLRERFQVVVQRYGLKPSVRLTLSQSQTSPVALGADEICIPERLITFHLQPDEQVGVLAHEAAHLVRRDPSWLLALVAVESIFFFQPLNRVARMNIQDEAEFLSDDMAIERGSSGVTMARCLSRVAEWISSSPQRSLAPAFVERRASLVSRVKRLLEEKSSPSTRVSFARRALSVTLVPLMVLVIAPGFTAGGDRAWGTPAFRWVGVLAPGEVVEIKGLMGDIRAEPWSGPTVVVEASRHGRATDPDVQFAVVKSPGGVSICTIYPVSDGVQPNVCVPGNGGREFNTKANDVEVDYLVRIPAGRGFSGWSGTGNITSGILSGPVVAHSMSGKVDVATTSYASASSSAGNVRVRIGSTSWADTLRIGSSSGDITVILPATASSDIQAQSRLGTVRSDFPLDGKSPGWRERLKLHGSFGGVASGRAGNGQRSLVIRTTAGNIAIRRDQ